MTETWEIRTRKTGERNCEVGNFWCGYCEQCVYLGKAWCEIEAGRTLEDWRVRNYEQCTRMRMLDRARRRVVQQKIEDELRCDSDEENKFRWLKISFPKSEVNYKKVIEKTEILMREDKYSLGNSIMVLEFHSKNSPEGGNLHLHLLAVGHCKTDKARCIRQLARYYKLETNFIDYKKGWGEDNFRIKLRYVCRYKTKEKMGFVRKDQIWREQQKLPEVVVLLCDQLKCKYDKDISKSTGSTL